MKYDPEPHHRRSIRLRGHDYAEAGATFVTICTADRACILGKVVDGEGVVSESGRVVQAVWGKLPASEPGCRTDQLVVMPNHIHGIVWLEAEGGVESGRVGARFIAPLTLGAVVRTFKARSTWAIGRATGKPGTVVWQRNYHERIVRSDAELDRIRRYIALNPLSWASDRENPDVAVGIAGPGSAGPGHPESWAGRPGGAMNRAPTRQRQDPSPLR